MIKQRQLDKSLCGEIIEWDVTSWAKALYFWDKGLPASLAGLNALEIGSRNGGLSLYLALKGCRVVCSDLGGPTDQAIELHRRHGVEQLITYEDIDATRIDRGDKTFDIVAFKSCLGSVGAADDEKPKLAVNEIHRVLKFGGRVLFSENLRGSLLHMFARKKYVAWGSQWRYMSLQEMREIFSAFSEWDYRTGGFLSAFGRSERQRRFLAGLDYAIDPLLSESMRYIIYGCARK